MWVNLGLDDRGLPASVGSGLAHKHQPIAVYPISSLIHVEVPSEEVDVADLDDELFSSHELTPRRAKGARQRREAGEYRACRQEGRHPAQVGATAAFS